nr:endo-alpha-N-acetylgalactosaminidase family protein [Tessaracoccus coleopterorum]
MIVANNSELAAAFDTNATEDNTGPSSTSGRVSSGNNRYQNAIVEADGYKLGTAYAGTWTWLAEGVVAKGGDTSIGRENDPFVEIKLTADANADAVVDWQDGAIATRDIVLQANGTEDVPDTVIARIPFNIVSQATHPFLRTLDDTKKIALATDNLGQQVLLKGYQSEGHDAAHPDYADNYNIRAGGYDDLVKLVDEGANWNAMFGVHVNATESYSEANAFSEDLLYMPPRKAWAG